MNYRLPLSHTHSCVCDPAWNLIYIYEFGPAISYSKRLGVSADVAAYNNVCHVLKVAGGN